MPKGPHLPRHGFEGQLPLFLNSKPTQAVQMFREQNGGIPQGAFPTPRQSSSERQGILEVFLEVQPQGVKINRSVNRRGARKTARVGIGLA